MKKLNLKKILVLVIALTIGITSICAFTACSSQKKTIGIIQFGTHESLNDCYNGMVEGLKEGLGSDFDNYEIELQNSNFDASVSGTQAQTFVNKNVSMIGAIATPSAMAAASASNGSIPVIYCAVSDPVAAGLDQLTNVSGSSDLLDFQGQLDLIKAFIPDVDKIGVLYTTTEENSKSQLKTLTTVAATMGIEVVSKAITNVNEIATATDSLLATEGLDCVTNLTDNTVVGALDTVLEKTNAKNIPVFGSEIDQVKKGCIASASLDYVALGKQTGLLMAKVLKGEAVASNDNAIKVESSFNCYSASVATKLNITVPASAGRNVD